MLDIQRFEMITHHAEQEVKRLDAIIKAITIINPMQVKHLRKVLSSFCSCGNVAELYTLITLSLPSNYALFTL